MTETASRGLSPERIDEALSLSAAVASAGERPALVGPDFSVSYRELGARVAARRDALDALGVPPGGSVAFTPGLDTATVEIVHALVARRCPIVLLHPRWTEREREHALATSGARWLRVSDGGDLRVEAARRTADATPPRGPDDPDPILAIAFTSGSSGAPKGALLSRRALVASALGSAARLGTDERTRWLLSLPPAHVGGLSVITRMLVARGTVALGEPTSSFDPERLARTLVELRVTSVSLVPVMLSRLLDTGWSPPPTLRVVLLGGAATSRELRARAAALGVPLRVTYGLTEACSQVATTETLDEPGCGRPLEGVQVRVERGAIEVRGESLFAGYLGEPRRDPGAWFATHDRGEVDSEGRLHVLGRGAELIVTGGENVYPAEVEAALSPCEGVDELAVAGEPDPAWGERVVAYVVAPGDPREVAARLEARAAERLAAFKRPRVFVFVEALPRIGIAKVARRRLAECPVRARVDRDG